MDCGLGTKYWQETQYSCIIRPYKHQNYPPTVLGGHSPQALLNREASTHTNPNSDNANEMIVSVGIELPDVDDFNPEDAWSSWDKDNSGTYSSYLASDETNPSTSPRRKGRKTHRFHSSFTTMSTDESTSTETITSDNVIAEPKGYVSTRVEKIELMLYDSYTQVSPDMQTCGRGNNAMPIRREKVKYLFVFIIKFKYQLLAYYHFIN